MSRLPGGMGLHTHTRSRHDWTDAGSTATGIRSADGGKARSGIRAISGARPGLAAAGDRQGPLGPGGFLPTYHAVVAKPGAVISTNQFKNGRLCT
jgi:hypothetical protein